MAFNELERRAIVAQGDFILGAAVDELEDSLRQPAPRQLAQIVDVVSYFSHSEVAASAIAKACVPAPTTPA